MTRHLFRLHKDLYTQLEALQEKDIDRSVAGTRKCDVVNCKTCDRLIPGQKFRSSVTGKEYNFMPSKRRLPDRTNHLSGKLQNVP